jgi:4-hydroxybenzoate polyprenyltransferase
MSGKFALPRLAEETIGRIETLNVPPLVLSLYLAFVVFLREVLELLFFERSYSLDQFVHHFFFYAVVFLAGTLLLSLIGELPILQTTRITAAGFFLIVLAPLIDRFVALRGGPYDYLLPHEFLKNFLTFFLFTPKAGAGIKVEIWAILGLSSLFIFLRTRSAGRAFFAGLSLYVLVALSATPRLLMPILRITDPSSRGARHLVYASVYLFFSLVLGLLYLGRIERTLPKAILQELATLRTLHFVVMVCAGSYVHLGPTIFRFPNSLALLFACVLMVLLWLSAVLLNNACDLEIDKITNRHRPLVNGQIRPSLYIHLSLILGVIILGGCVIFKVTTSFLIFLALLSSVAYSLPPLRLRSKIWSSVFIGWGSCLSFLIGYFMGTPLIQLSLPKDILLFALVIFIAFTLGPLTKDLKDYPGDRQNGVKTLFTVFGRQKGKRIVTVLLWISLLVPLIIFHADLDFAVLGALASVTAVLFYVGEKLVISFAGYGTVLAYCLFRLLG